MLQEPKVVMDTNIIISAALSIDGLPAKIFKLFLEGKIENYVSKESMDELTRVIARKGLSIPLEFQEFILTNVTSKSKEVVPECNYKLVKEDPSDNKFVNCALAAKADIISGDRHLLAVKKFKECRILSAKEFLKEFEDQQKTI